MLKALNSLIERRHQVSANPKASADLGIHSDKSGFTGFHNQPARMMKFGAEESVDGAKSETRTDGASAPGAAQFSIVPEMRQVTPEESAVGAFPASNPAYGKSNSDDSDDSDASDVDRGSYISPESLLDVLREAGEEGGGSGHSVRARVPFSSPETPVDSIRRVPLNAPRVLNVSSVSSHAGTSVSYKSVLRSHDFNTAFGSSNQTIISIQNQHCDNRKVQTDIFFPIEELIVRINKRIKKYKSLLQDSDPSQAKIAKIARLEKVLVRLMARVIELSKILNDHSDNLENVSFEGWYDGNSKKGRSHINAVVIRGNGDRIHLKTSVQKVYGDTPNYEMLDKIKMAENGEVCFEDQKAMPFHQRGGWTPRRDESLWVDPRSRSRTHDSNQGAGQIWGQVPEQASQAGVFEMPYSSQESRTRYENEIICSLERKAASDQTRFLGQARGTSGPSSGQLGMSGRVTTRVQGSAAFSSHQPSQTVAVSQPRDTQEGEGGPPRIVQSSLGGTGIQGRTPDSNQGAGRRWGEVPGQEIYSSLFESQAGVSGMPNSSQESGTGFGAATLSFLGMPGSHQIPVEGPVQARGASGHPSGQPGMSGRGGAQELQSAAFSSHQPSGTVPGYQPRDTKEGEDGTSRRDQSPWGVTGFRSRTPNSNQGADQSTAWGEDLGQEIYSTQVGSCTELYGPYSPQESGTGFGAASLSFLGIQDSHQIPVEGTVQAGGTSGLPSRQLGTSGMVSEHRSAFSPTTGSEGLPLRTCVDGGREDQGVYPQGASKHITYHSVTRLDFQPGHSLSNSCRSAHLAQQQDIHTSKTMCI